MNEYNPDKVFPPGETIKELLADHGMTQEELARRMGKSPEFVDRLISGHIALSPRIAIYLENIFVKPAACFWNNLEMRYRVHKVEVTLKAVG